MKKRVWLENIRKAKYMTHQQVADQSGIKRQHYSMIEAGDRRPSVETAKSVAKVLGFNWTYFFEHEGNKTRQKAVE